MATAAGAVLILTLPLVPGLKALFGLLWLLSGAAEFRALRHGMSRIERIRMGSDGSVDGFDRRNAKYPLCLLPGSVVLDRVAWLRLRFADGLRYGELVTGNAHEDEQWRRLLILWRHQAAFGRPVEADTIRRTPGTAPASSRPAAAAPGPDSHSSKKCR